MQSFYVTGERVIAAPRQKLFDVGADPAKHSEFDGSGTVRGEISSTSPRLKLGAKFGMNMRKGIKYRMTNTVVEFEEGHLIAWKPAGNYIWRYRFEDVAGGTVVTEEWDARKFKLRFGLWLLGVPRSTKHAIDATLRRLAEITETAT